MVERIPYANRKKVKRLPGPAKLILSIAKEKLSSKEFKMLEHTFVDVAQVSNRPKPVMSEKSAYGGALNQYGYNIVEELGVYNPSEIPLNIFQKMKRHPTIALGTAVIVSTITGLNKRIECEDDVQGKIIYKILNKVYNNATKKMLDAICVGFAPGEKCWDWTRINIKDFDEEGKKKTIVDDYFWTLDKIKFVNPSTIRIRIDEKGNFKGFTQLDPFMGIFKKINPNKTVLYTHNEEYGNWFGIARYANIYPYWYWSMVLMQFALKYYERLGQPLTLMRAPRGTSTAADRTQVDNMQYALKIGQAAISNSVVALPSDFDKNSNKPLWDMSLLGDVPRGNMFIDILNRMDSYMLRGLFVPDRMGLASDGSPHSATGASAGDTLDVFIMIQQALATDIENVWNEQVIPDIQAFNFDEDEIVEASLRIEKIDYNKKLLLKDMLLRMVMFESGAIRDGKIPKRLPSVAKICEMLDVPMELFKETFDEIAMDPLNPTIPGKKNSIDTKIKQDKNNADRGTARKERSGKERSAKEKR